MNSTDIVVTPSDRNSLTRSASDPTLQSGMRQFMRDAMVVAVVASLVLAAWAVTRMRLFKSGDDFSYWLAVAGATMMLLVFLYPLRKRFPALYSLGRVKWWLWAHIACGLVGPWFILVHSTFRIGSLNAGVAMYSMLIVVASGVIGRFLYVRVHRGLDGELTTLRELQVRAGFVESDARGRLAFAPKALQLLQDFERRELVADPGWRTHFRQVLVLPFKQWLTQWRCYRALDLALHSLAGKQSWPPADLARRRRLAHKLVRKYVIAVVRVAQFTAYERLLGLWHIGHLPFVYLLVFSAVVHIVAVHAY